MSLFKTEDHSKPECVKNCMEVGSNNQDNIKSVRNLFKLKKENETIQDSRDFRTLFG